MEYEIDINGTVAAVTLTGGVTIEYAVQLKELLSRVLPDATEVIVNLENITHLDLSGIQLLCAASRSLEGGRTTLVAEWGDGEVVHAALVEAGFNRHGVCAEQRCETCFWKGDSA